MYTWMRKKIIVLQKCTHKRFWKLLIFHVRNSSLNVVNLLVTEVSKNNRTLFVIMDNSELVYYIFTNFLVKSKYCLSLKCAFQKISWKIIYFSVYYCYYLLIYFILSICTKYLYLQIFCFFVGVTCKIFSYNWIKNLSEVFFMVTLGLLLGVVKFYN